MKKLFFPTLLFLGGTVFSQTISGVTNKYSKVSSLGDCANTIVVEEPSYFEVGKDIILIQMQGAIITETDDANFGNITDYNGAGSYEKARITGKSNDTLFFQNNFANTYDFNGAVQAVTFPEWNDVTVSSTLTAPAWDGETGGVVAIQAQSRLTLNAPIDVSGLGFRGGEKTEISGNGCTWILRSPAYFYPNTSWEGANKGEGIATDIAGKEFGKGPQANGGGGGNDHNSGGAGGSNYGVGGNGGENMAPGTFACQGPNPGLGGKALNYSGFKAFFGGGGGAGHGNNTLSSAGGNGGGIVIISCGSLLGTDKRILANGIAAENTAGSDGAGGGGAGGTIILNAVSHGTDLTLEAKGGNGGNSNNDFDDRCIGPGGGGAGGYIHSAYAMTGVTTDVSGGIPGIVDKTSNGCQGSNNNATGGGNGLATQGLILPFGKDAPECLTVGIEQFEIAQLLVYPNPTSSAFTIESPINETIPLMVTDIKGAIVDQFNLHGKLQIGANYSKGIYFVSFLDKAGAQSVKLVKLK